MSMKLELILHEARLKWKVKLLGHFVERALADRMLNTDQLYELVHIYIVLTNVCKKT